MQERILQRGKEMNMPFDLSNFNYHKVAFICAYIIHISFPVPQKSKKKKKLYAVIFANWEIISG